MEIIKVSDLDTETFISLSFKINTPEEAPREPKEILKDKSLDESDSLLNSIEDFRMNTINFLKDGNLEDAF